MLRVAVLLIAALFVAAPAIALDGIPLDQPVAETGADECPLLTKIKYPFLTCATNQWGGKTIVGATVAANATWEQDRQMPRGYWEIEEDEWYWRTYHP